MAKKSAPVKSKLTLRNFKVEDDVFYPFEYVAEQNNRSTTRELAEVMKSSVEQFRRANPDKVDENTGQLPYSSSRKIKMGL